MKHLLIIALATLLLSSCGGVYTITSGRQDGCTLSFVDEKAYNIEVTIDGEPTTMKTVAQRVWRKNRKIKKTERNSIKLTTGKHSIRVVRNGDVIIEKDLFLSTGEHKIIEL